MTGSEMNRDLIDVPAKDVASRYRRRASFGSVAWGQSKPIDFSGSNWIWPTFGANAGSMPAGVAFFRAGGGHSGKSCRESRR